MPKKRKLLWISFLLLICCAMAALTASAADTVDWNKTGSVSVTLKGSNTAVPGAEITLYKVADAVKKNGNLDFAFTDAFADCAESPSEFQDTASIRRLADYAKKQNIGGKILRTDKNGFLCFENLSLGLYLAVQSGSVKDYSDCSPFLVSVPSRLGDEWIYDIDATPKTDVVRLVDITVEIVWNENETKRPPSIIVELVDGDTVVDTVILNEENGWKYTWTGLPMSDKWFVRQVNLPDGYTAVYQNDGFVFTITNNTELIDTGQLKWPIPVMAGAGLLLFAFGWILFFSGKRKDHA